MSTLLNLPEDVRIAKLTHGFIDDFNHCVTADLWTKVLTDSGSANVSDAAGGVIALVPSDGSVGDNDEAVLHTSSELFLFAADKPAVCGARLKFTEANTNDANVLFGFSSAAATNILQDDGAGPLASYSGAVFFKADGSTLWSVEKSIGGTQVTVELTAANSLDGIAKTAASTAYQWLEIEVKPTSGSLADFNFYIDGVLVYRMKDETIASATEMDVAAAVKNGDTNLETLNVDCIYAYQKR